MTEDTTGTQLAQLARMEALSETLGDMHDDLKRLRAEIATSRAVMDQLMEALEKIAKTPYFTGKAIADLVSAQRG